MHESEELIGSLPAPRVAGVISRAVVSAVRPVPKSVCDASVLLDVVDSHGG